MALLYFLHDRLRSDAKRSLGTIYIKMLDKKERTISQEEAMNETRDLLVNESGKIVVEPFRTTGPKGGYELSLYQRPRLEEISFNCKRSFRAIASFQRVSGHT